MQEPDNHKYDMTLEMMKYYQDEFEYRHKHYWVILIKLFLLYIIITALPLLSEAMGFSLSDVGKTHLFLFPIFGFFIACLTFLILSDEAKKIGAVNQAKYEINRLLPPVYRYRDYVTDKSDPKYQLARHLVLMVFCTELLMNLAVIIVLVVSP